MSNSKAGIIPMSPFAHLFLIHLLTMLLLPQWRHTSLPSMVSKGLLPKSQLHHCLFQDIFALGQYFLWYQEIKFGKESEAAPKGFELSVCLSVDGDFFFFLVSYFFLLLFSVGLTCEGLVLTESHSSG